MCETCENVQINTPKVTVTVHSRQNPKSCVTHYATMFPKTMIGRVPESLDNE